MSGPTRRRTTFGPDVAGEPSNDAPRKGDTGTAFSMTSRSSILNMVSPPVVGGSSVPLPEGWQTGHIEADHRSPRLDGRVSPRTAQTRVGTIRSQQRPHALGARLSPPDERPRDQGYLVSPRDSWAPSPREVEDDIASSPRLPPSPRVVRPATVPAFSSAGAARVFGWGQSAPPGVSSPSMNSPRMGGPLATPRTDAASTAGPDSERAGGMTSHRLMVQPVPLAVAPARVDFLNHSEHVITPRDLLASPRGFVSPRGPAGPVATPRVPVVNGTPHLPVKTARTEQTPGVERDAEEIWRDTRRAQTARTQLEPQPVTDGRDSPAGAEFKTGVEAMLARQLSAAQERLKAQEVRHRLEVTALQSNVAELTGRVVEAEAALARRPAAERFERPSLGRQSSSAVMGRQASQPALTRWRSVAKNLGARGSQGSLHAGSGGDGSVSFPAMMSDGPAEMHETEATLHNRVTQAEQALALLRTWGVSRGRSLTADEADLRGRFAGELQRELRDAHQGLIRLEESRAIGPKAVSGEHAWDLVVEARNCAQARLDLMLAMFAVFAHLPPAPAGSPLPSLSFTDTADSLEHTAVPHQSENALQARELHVLRGKVSQYREERAEARAQRAALQKENERLRSELTGRRSSAGVRITDSGVKMSTRVNSRVNSLPLGAVQAALAPSPRPRSSLTFKIPEGDEADADAVNVHIDDAD